MMLTPVQLMTREGQPYISPPAMAMKALVLSKHLVVNNKLIKTEIQITLSADRCFPLLDILLAMSPFLVP